MWSFTHPQIQTRMSVFLLLNIKEDILKNVGNQIVQPLTLIIFSTQSMEINDYKYISILCHESVLLFNVFFSSTFLNF